MSKMKNCICDECYEYKCTKCDKEKLEGALLMARTCCHEMAQTMQAIVGYAEMIGMGHKQDKVDPEHITELIRQVMRLRITLKKSHNIVRLKTNKNIVVDERYEVIDLEESTSEHLIS